MHAPTLRSFVDGKMAGSGHALRRRASCSDISSPVKGSGDPRWEPLTPLEFSTLSSTVGDPPSYGNNKKEVSLPH